MITPRQTRLLNVPDLQTFQRTIGTCLGDAGPWERRSTVVLVPSRGAADQLRWTLEQQTLVDGTALALPRLLTRDGLYSELHRRAHDPPPLLKAVERLVCGRAAADDAIASGVEPPFRLRPGLVSQFLTLYDELRRRHRSVDAFERLLVAELEPNAEFDRGARRLLRQTRFLAAMFRAYERRVALSGQLDEHGLRVMVIDRGLRRPLYHVVVTVPDRAAGPDGLWSGDYDLLARLPDVVRIDLVATSGVLAAGMRERLNDLLPGVEEIRLESSRSGGPRLVVPADGAGHRYFTWRDREEELLGIIRRVKRRPPGERTAVVFQRPLPYLYLAGHLFPSAGVPFETRDTFPLAAEPFAAAVDLVLSFVSSGHARLPAIELLRSPQFQFEREGSLLDPLAVTECDRALFDARYLGGRSELRRLATAWAASARNRRASSAAVVAATVADELDELSRPGPSTGLLNCLLRFFERHRALPPADPDVASRESRGRAAVVGLVRDLRDAHVLHDDPVVDLPALTATLRRLMEAATFAVPGDTGGVTFLDVQAARYGVFDSVSLVGLLDGEWPERTRQSSLYPTSLLMQLGWSRDIERLRAARAGLVDLLGLADDRVSVSTVSLEEDVVVAGSALLEDLEDTNQPLVFEASPRGRVTAEAGLAEVPDAVPLVGVSAEWLELRRRRGLATGNRYRGDVGPRPSAKYAVSGVERYLSCPFKYFASVVLKLDEEPDDELTMSPRTRGRFVHDVFRAFFERWQGEGLGDIDVEHLDRARALAREVAEERLAELPVRDRPVERIWLLGSPAGMGVIDRLLSLEAEHPDVVIDRLLEHRFDGDFQLVGVDGPRTVRLRGIVDRVDLLEGNRVRVIDYKTGRVPGRGRALQLPVYGRCAEQELGGRDGRPWTIDTAAYVAFGEARPWVSLERNQQIGEAVAEGERRFLEAVDGIERGQFLVRPDQPHLCVYCEYPTVCRKDYVGDD